MTTKQAATAAYPDAPVWATVQQASQHTGLGVSTLRRYIRTGIFPSHRIGGNLRVNLREIDARMTAAAGEH